MADKERYIPRDLSWLDFNERVLTEASNSANPLIERLKFVAIFVNNFDEFWMVRVAGLKRLIQSGYGERIYHGATVNQILTRVRNRAHVLTTVLAEVYQHKLKKAMRAHHISLARCDDLTQEQKKHVGVFFEKTLFSIITPRAVDEGHPFPVLPSKTLAFAVRLSRYNKESLAVIPIPDVISRVVRLPSAPGEYAFILVEEILRHYLGNFFKGYKIVEEALFRVIRDSELSLEGEYAPDLLNAIERQIKKRPRAHPVYVEVENSCSIPLLEMLCESINFSKEEVVNVEGDLGLTYLFDLISRIPNVELRDRRFLPKEKEYENIFDLMREQDFLVHLPYESFASVLNFIETSARDKRVLAIKITLYRTNEDSRIIHALKEAAKNKKHVTVLLELKARFDEEQSIAWARELEDAGCHVIYGIPGMKVHSKMTLVVRQGEGGIERYVHLSTGNYNEKTARLYTDIGYFTVNEDIAQDISEIFNVITGFSMPGRWRRVVSSPFNLRQYFMELIDKEIAFQKRNKNGFIFAKMNSLEDKDMIDKLYEASRAGVKIRLIVRGICCLVPGIRGQSDTIEVRSIVGRFLEHSRIFLFHNNSDYRVFLSSADWMTRNLDHRVELFYEIIQESLKGHLRFILDSYWKDTQKSWELIAPGEYRQRGSGKGLNTQEYLIDYYAGVPFDTRLENT